MAIELFDRATLDALIPSRITSADVVLDIGPGIRPQTLCKPLLHICCEPYIEYVSYLQNLACTTPGLLVIQQTASELLDVLPDRSVDSIFLVDVIEHLTKEEGRQLLDECDRVGRKQIIVFTPLGFLAQDYNDNDVDGWGMRGGRWQAHKSGWNFEDFGDAWDILACNDYHSTNGKGEVLDPPAGALWAIKDLKSLNRDAACEAAGFRTAALLTLLANQEREKYRECKALHARVSGMAVELQARSAECETLSQLAHARQAECETLSQLAQIRQADCETLAHLVQAWHDKCEALCNSISGKFARRLSAAFRKILPDRCLRMVRSLVEERLARWRL